MISRPLTALSIQRPRRILKARQHTLKLGATTLLMGIVNLTPDSFSRDGRLSSSNKIIHHIRFAQQLIAQGADILDLGAESSRPGAVSISVKEELNRLIPTLKRLVEKVKVPISVDTYKPQVAQAALDAGASIINNIHGAQLDKSLLKMVRDCDAAIVLMHMRGDSKTMQKKIHYKNILKEIMQELKPSIEKCLEMGIKKNRIIIDPGLGFAKTADQNLVILKNLNQLNSLACPILIGPSRKSFIGKITDKPVEERLMGTAAAVSLAIAAGADIVRVHDVAAMKDVINISDAIINGSSSAKGLGVNSSR